MLEAGALMANDALRVLALAHRRLDVDLPDADKSAMAPRSRAI